MALAPLALLLIALGALAWFLLRRERNRQEIARYSLSPQQLRALLDAPTPIALYDVRQPLDLLADTFVIPGSRRIPPADVLANPAVIPADQDSVIYCTCPSDRTSRRILHRALSLQFCRIRFLKGGLAGWRAQGFPVEPYKAVFHLDTAS